MRVYIISGEKSGDIYGGHLVNSLLRIDPLTKIRGFGGDRMNEAGVEVVNHINSLSFMGFSEVLKNIWLIKGKLSFCKKDIICFNPDIIILIDFPGFNMKIAKFAKKNGVKVFYYISPKVWAWKKDRIEKIRKYVDELIVIFPFEVDFLKRSGIESNYFGNPIYDEMTRILKPLSVNSNKRIISILPGSRKQEIKRNLPIMLSVIPLFKEYEFFIASTSNMFPFIKSLCKEIDVKIVVDETYSLLKKSEIALVTSGTATLEAALFNVPQLVCYKTDFFTYKIAKLFVKLNWISLVNIILDKLVVREFIQENMKTENLVNEINYLHLLMN